MRRVRFEWITPAAPLLLAPVVIVACVRGTVPLLETCVFVTLLFIWGGALAIAQQRATARAREAMQRQELEASVQRAVGLAETEDDLLDIAGQALARALPGMPAEVLLTDENGGEIHLAAIAAAGAPGCPVATASACAALRTGQTQVFAEADALHICPRLRARPGGAKPAVCVPLAVMGRTIGVLHTTTTPEQPFTARQVGSLEGIASQVGSRLRMLQMVDELQKQAMTDSLTGLPNRRSFEERASRALRSRAGSVVAIADLDHFKSLNDSAGHAVGDRALRIFADSLRSTFADRHDIVARLGGEEFAIILPKADADAARKAFARARADLAAAIDRQGSVAFTVSFGIALAPEHGHTVSELLAAADRALYAAKANGRDCEVIVGDFPPESERRRPESTFRFGPLPLVSAVPAAPIPAAAPTPSPVPSAPPDRSAALTGTMPSLPSVPAGPVGESERPRRPRGIA